MILRRCYTLRWAELTVWRAQGEALQRQHLGALKVSLMLNPSMVVGLFLKQLILPTFLDSLFDCLTADVHPHLEHWQYA